MNEHTSQSPTTSIRRISDLIARPGLEIHGMSRFLVCDVGDSKTFNGFKGPVVLSDTADCYSQPGGEYRVSDCDIGGVSFRADTVVAVDDFPVGEGDVLAIDSVGTVGVLYCQVVREEL